jgi:hypothetical protein
MTTDAIERVFIGSASNLSGSPKIPDTSAVLEIHNHSRPKVVINGDLLVAGGIEFGGFCTIEQRYSGDMLSCDDRLGNSIDPGYFVNYSDLRLKNVKGENKSGLDKIKQLKVFNYTFKDDKKKTPRVGVIAQDLQKIFPDAVTKDEKGYLLIRMEDMFYALVNAVKELANRDAAKDAKIKELEKTLKQVQGDNTALEKRIQKLEAKLQ